MAKFPIVLYSKEVMAVSRKIDYVLNGCQFMSFDVEASIIATTVGLSKRELVFDFEMDNWETFVDQVGSLLRWISGCIKLHSGIGNMKKPYSKWLWCSGKCYSNISV